MFAGFLVIYGLVSKTCNSIAVVWFVLVGRSCNSIAVVRIGSCCFRSLLRLTDLVLLVYTALLAYLLSTLFALSGLLKSVAFRVAYSV